MNAGEGKWKIGKDMRERGDKREKEVEKKRLITVTVRQETVRK